MSTLTKVLIVLLTLSSLVVCATVVTYVASSSNYKQMYDKQTGDLQAAKRMKASAEKAKTETIQKTDLDKKDLNTKIASLGAQIKQLQTTLEGAEREKKELDRKVQQWASVTADLTKTADSQRALFVQTQDDLNKANAELTRFRKELTETSNTLFEKIAIIETLEAKNRRLLEEKTTIQEQMDRGLFPQGQQAGDLAPVTPLPGKAQRAPRGLTTVIQPISLNGLITAVDMKNSIASISIGAADGVKKDMKFHVTRGSKFICDVKVIEVDTEEAVGVLSLVQEPPRVRDNVSTNW